MGLWGCEGVWEICRRMGGGVVGVWEGRRGEGERAKGRAEEREEGWEGGKYGVDIVGFRALQGLKRCEAKGWHIHPAG